LRASPHLVAERVLGALDLGCLVRNVDYVEVLADELAD
jgi:hypothetical protein